MRSTTQVLLTSALILAVMLPGSALALKDDTKQPINILSVEQVADLAKNELTFIGNVTATQGSMKIDADKIEIKRNDEGKLQSIIAFGSPATFEQLMDNGKTIKSRSSTISYLPGSSDVILQGKVTVWQGESQLSGERIEYNVTTQRMRAENAKSQGGRVTSTFIPSELKQE